MQIMGILNVTPDSFSDGGLHLSLDDAVGQASRMIEEGVDIIDIGGESTRPFAEPVSLDQELERVIPVIEAIRAHHTIPISIDTTKAGVARQAIAAGADIINDVSALEKDPAMLELLRDTSVPVIIMHMKGTPETMQVNPEYSNVVEEVLDYFRERLQWFSDMGIAAERITIDPGIGFGKTVAHNLSLLKHIDRLAELGHPILLGHSRKRFLGEITGLDPEDRDLPTAVISALALSQKVDTVRVHNVAASHNAVKIAEAILTAS